MDIPQPLGNFRLLAPSPLEFPLTFRGVGGGGDGRFLEPHIFLFEIEISF